ncbi:hypothetical protein HFN80_05720 [Rhizobium laguerreae]|uniref:hypothetical protein n=1 Tax=Rhizobium laguerreae TaxID=1076926 RepID=UPI001C90FAB7|nr:hypothetical protein [Rhizobium laguerreae]MBY3463512.1 hypothetical protein [Rhizobium laguerreae]
MKSLSPVAGKTIAIIGEPGFLSEEVKEAFVARQAVIVDKGVGTLAMHGFDEMLVCDAVIIDVTISDETMLAMNGWLESQRIPFVFARDSQYEATSAGFILSDRPADINAIVAALFGPDTGYYH